MKVKRVVFEVRWDETEGVWIIYRFEERYGSYPRKADALIVAKAAAKSEERAELKVKNKKGRIQERFTYPRSSDPKGRG